MLWKTRITEILGCKYPILQGAIAYLGSWEFAASVARAGAHGTITASVCRTPEKLRENINNCRKAIAGAPGTFGINLSIGICPDIEQMLEICIEEKVTVETSIYKPDTLAAKIKMSGLKWIHKAARLKDALHAQELGADVIILVGLEGAGIKSPDQLPTMTTIIWGKKQLKVPLIASGGIGDARGFLAALGMGADGIMMGSAFCLTKECPLADSNKAAIINLHHDSIEFRQQVMEPRKVGDIIRSANVESTILDWTKEVSFAVGVIDHVVTVKELIDSIIYESEHILNSCKLLRSD